MAEYAMRYGLPLEKLIDDSVIRRFKESVSCLEFKQHVRQTRHQNACKKAAKFQETLNPNTEQIIYGTLLGDGYLWQGKKQFNSTYLACDHGIAQVSYLMWKMKYLEETCGAKIFQRIYYNTTAHRVTASTYLATKSHPYFGQLSREFYNEKGKTISDKILERLDDLGVAVWYMDDGNITNGISFAAQCFSSADRQKLARWLSQRYDANFYETPSNEIRTLKAEEGHFLDRITPYILPQFYYKVRYKASFPEAVLCKRFQIDAAHFLEDYTGKCFRGHGHLWILDVAVKGPIDPVTGMVLDYAYIKIVVKKLIEDILDHHIINYQVRDLRRRATSELLAVWIWKVLVEFLPGLEYIRLYEQPDSSWVEYRGPTHAEIKKGILDPLFKWAEFAWQTMLKEYPDIMKYQVVNLREDFNG